MTAMPQRDSDAVWVVIKMRQQNHKCACLVGGKSNVEQLKLARSDCYVLDVASAQLSITRTCI